MVKLQASSLQIAAVTGFHAIVVTFMKLRYYVFIKGDFNFYGLFELVLACQNSTSLDR